jgi:hypothetical protein
MTCTVADATTTLGTTQYVLTGWNLAGLVDNNGTSTGATAQVIMTLTNNTILTWQWTTNFRFAVTSSIGGTTTGSTTGWYSVSATIAVTAVPSAHFHFNGWSGDTSGDTNSSGLTAMMERPRSLTANFSRDLHTLTISSPHGSPLPATGTHTNEYDSVLTNSMTASPESNGGTQYVCAGWSMTGNDPPSGSSLSFNMTLTNNAALSWLWLTNYLLSVEADAGGTVTGNSSGWHAAGTNIILQAVPAANFTFRGWSGDTPGDTNTTALTFLMDRARQVKAHFAAETFPPSAPGNVTASEGTYTDKVVIAWTGGANSEGYEIWRDLTATNAVLRAGNLNQTSKIYRAITATAQKIGATTDLVFNDTSTIAGFVYSYWIAGTNPVGTGSFSEPAEGWRRCVPVALAADFDGDAKADPAVIQLATGDWRVRLSLPDYAVFDFPAFLGRPDEKLLAADFDGDQLTDYAVYRPETGNWSIRFSGINYELLELRELLGTTNDIPLAADFDGDAKADPAVSQPATGDWRIRLSLPDYAVFDFPAFLGRPDEWPLAADFDGDRFADCAVCRTETGNWRIRFSGMNYELLEFRELLGATNDIPLAADFDGDAKADPAGITGSRSRVF